MEPTSSTEILMAAMALITTAGAVLTGAVAKLWAWIDKRIADCEKDRTVLHEKVNTLNGDVLTISTTMVRMEEHLKFIDTRRDSDHPESKAKRNDGGRTDRRP